MNHSRRAASAVVSIVLIAGLAAYGAQALSSRQGSAIAGIADGRQPSQGVVLSRARRMPKTDQEVAGTLGLTKQQMARFKKHDAEKTARNQQLKQMKSGHFEYGAKINKWWNDGLKSIFTTKQYAQYCAAWSGGGSSGEAAAVAYSPARPVVGRAHNGVDAAAPRIANPAEAAFGGQENRILASLNLSAQQSAGVSELYAKLDKENQKLRELWKGDDPDAVGWQSSKINKMQRAGMQAILTPEQHEKYLAAWHQVMKPYMATGERASRRARMVVGGKASSATYAPLTEGRAQGPRGKQ
jgi:hypothetical protein